MDPDNRLVSMPPCDFMLIRGPAPAMLELLTKPPILEWKLPKLSPLLKEFWDAHLTVSNTFLYCGLKSYQFVKIRLNNLKNYQITYTMSGFDIPESVLNSECMDISNSLWRLSYGAFVWPREENKEILAPGICLFLSLRICSCASRSKASTS